MTDKRDEFSKETKDTVAKRAAYICSNPDCKRMTLAPDNGNKFIYIGVISHIAAAATGGPRYDELMSDEQRRYIDNAIFLCNNCGTMIDKNNGLDFPVNILKQWKNDHENWTKQNLNKTPISSVIVNGQHYAKGQGNVTAMEISGPAIIQPGTISIAEGVGNITATKITGRK